MMVPKVVFPLFFFGQRWRKSRDAAEIYRTCVFCFVFVSRWKEWCWNPLILLSSASLRGRKRVKKKKVPKVTEARIQGGRIATTRVHHRTLSLSLSFIQPRCAALFTPSSVTDSGGHRFQVMSFLPLLLPSLAHFVVEEYAALFLFEFHAFSKL